MTDSKAAFVQHLVQRALELPAAARPAFVAGKCGRDERLRAEVEALLHDAGDQQFRAPEHAAERQPARDAAPASLIGSHIDTYHLLQVLGEGGFGTVYLAEQREPVARHVAFKMLKPGMDTHQVVARFEQERQALAMMDHPNIAKVFDAGVAPQGLPYFVMELCRGEPVVEWCDKNRWTLAQRLGLFAQICHAVQHAHGKGIIHRDLKPSNVLVGSHDGTPTAKVIDFGIAKALTRKLTERTLVTEVAQVIGTLEYMSPEQAEGSLDVDTRADVYSLGILLYELLTGSTPFVDVDRRGTSQVELHRRVLAGEPVRPSTRISAARDRLPDIANRRRTEPRRLSALLSGELDWIVLKAIERDRSRRYATAQELAQDVQRYLAGQPITAAPPSRVYLLRKFLRRNRATVAGFAGVGIALLVGAVAFAWQAREARHQRDTALAAQHAESLARERAEQVAALMEGVFRSIDPAAADDLGLPLREQLRERIEAGTAQLAATVGDDPLTRARMQAACATAFAGLSDYRRAEALFREAFATRRELLGPGHPDTIQTGEGLSAALLRSGRFEEAIEQLESLRREAGSGAAGDLVLGMAYRAAGRLDEALAVLEGERERLTARGELDTDDGLLTLHSLGACYRLAGRSDDAIELLEDVLRRRRQRLGEDHSDTWMTCNSLAVALGETGRHTDALRLYERTRERMLSRYGPDHGSVFAVETNIATQLGALGRAAEAIPMLELARTRCVTRHGPDHPDALRMGLTLGRLHYETEQYADALPLIADVVQRARSVDLGENPIADRATEMLARCHARTGRPEKAIETLQPLLEAAPTGERDRRHILSLRREVGGWQAEAGALDDAASTLEAVLLEQVEALGERDPDVMETLAALGSTQFARSESARAIETFERLLPRYDELHGPDHPKTIHVRGNLGSAYWQAGDYDRAIPILSEALAAAARVLGESHARTMGIALDLAINLQAARRDDPLFAHLRTWLPAIVAAEAFPIRTIEPLSSWFLGQCQTTRRFGEAVELLEAQREIMLRHLDEDSPAVLQVTKNLGTAYWFARRFDRSVPILQDVVERLRRVLGADDPRTLGSVVDLAVNLRDSGRANEALPLLEELVDRVDRGDLPHPQDLGFWRRELASTQRACGQRDRCMATVARYLADARSAAGGNPERLESDLSQAAVILVELGAHDAAEPLLRECLGIRERVRPNAWNTSYTRVLLGSCLHARHDDEAARALLVQGCTELRALTEQFRPGVTARMTESVDRLLAFLADVGDTETAAEWQAWRAQLER